MLCIPDGALHGPGVSHVRPNINATHSGRRDALKVFRQFLIGLWIRTTYQGQAYPGGSGQSHEDSAAIPFPPPVTSRTSPCPIGYWPAASPAARFGPDSISVLDAGQPRRNGLLCNLWPRPPRRQSKPPPPGKPSAQSPHMWSAPASRGAASARSQPHPTRVEPERSRVFPRQPSPPAPPGATDQRVPRSGSPAGTARLRCHRKR